MRDIASATGINTASIYYHYESKEALPDDIFSFFARGYTHYFEWLSEMNNKDVMLLDSLAEAGLFSQEAATAFIAAIALIDGMNGD